MNARDEGGPWSKQDRHFIRQSLHRTAATAARVVEVMHGDGSGRRNVRWYVPGDRWPLALHPRGEWGLTFVVVLESCEGLELIRWTRQTAPC